MIQTVAVGTDGSETANKAVEFALDMAEKFGAKVVIAQLVPAGQRGQASATTSGRRRRTSSGRSTRPRTSTRPCARSRSRRASRGLEVTSEAREGDPADVLCDIAEAARRRPARGRQQGHAAARARQRPEQRLPQGALLGGDRQDDVACSRGPDDGRRSCTSAYEALNQRRHRRARWRCSTSDAEWVEHSDLPEAGQLPRPRHDPRVPRELPRELGRLPPGDRGRASPANGCVLIVHALARARARAAASTVESRYAHLWTMRDGRGVRVDAYYDRDEALARAEARRARELSPASAGEQHGAPRTRRRRRRARRCRRTSSRIAQHATSSSAPSVA